MKAICPLSGVPFRTYDSLSLQWAVNHPIFSIPFERLVLLLDDIRAEEEKLIINWNKDSIDSKNEAVQAISIKDLTKDANLAMSEKQWKNPSFRLYQTKHLVMLALMNHAELLDVETGYAARPKPTIIDSHFWHATELFSWVCTLSNPQLHARVPRYRVSKDNEGMENIPEYLEAVDKIKTHIGSKYRDFSTDKKLAAWEMAISIIARRRDVLKQKLSTSTNPIAAKWALTITNCPKQYWDFWYAILSSSSTKITFEGVKIGDKWEVVTAGDLRELYDWLDDNLIRPKGDVNEYHRDDTEFYFIARQTVLDIVRTHVLILEQGTSSFRIVNAAVGDRIVSSNDDNLEIAAIKAGLNTKPKFGTFPTKIAFIKALAHWRMQTKNALLDIENAKLPPEQQSLNKDEKAKYEIL